jgi:hypothetical protein
MDYTTGPVRIVFEAHEVRQCVCIAMFGIFDVTIRFDGIAICRDALPKPPPLQMDVIFRLFLTTRNTELAKTMHTSNATDTSSKGPSLAAAAASCVAAAIASGNFSSLPMTRLGRLVEARPEKFPEIVSANITLRTLVDTPDISAAECPVIDDRRFNALEALLEAAEHGFRISLEGLPEFSANFGVSSNPEGHRQFGHD